MLFIKRKNIANSQVYPAIIMESYSDWKSMTELLEYVQKTYSVTFIHEQELNGTITLTCKNNNICCLTISTSTIFPITVIYDQDFNNLFAIRDDINSRYTIINTDEVVSEKIDNTLNTIFNLVAGVIANVKVTKAIVRINSTDDNIIAAIKKHDKIIFHEDFVDDDFHYTFCRYNDTISICFIWRNCSKVCKNIVYNVELINDTDMICRFTNKDRSDD